MKAGFELYLGKKIINVACFILIKHWRVVFAEGLKYNKTVIFEKVAFVLQKNMKTLCFFVISAMFL